MAELGKNAGSKGWQALLTGHPWFEHEGDFPIPAYSEFMPGPFIGIGPSAEVDPGVLDEADPFGWAISELEEETEIRPGMRHIGTEIVRKLIKLGRGEPAYPIAGHDNQNLRDNPYWPEALAQKAGQLRHERYVTLLPLMLSRTQDDKGRVSWTFFGNSIEEPEAAFWKGFYSAPGIEIPANAAMQVFVDILKNAYGEEIRGSSELASHGFRILPVNADVLPSWARKLAATPDRNPDKARYLLTFKPFAELPREVTEKYLAGGLHLLPFPGSLVFWGMPPYQHLAKQYALAGQLPLQHLVARNTGLGGIRVPQSGWFHEAHAGQQQIPIQRELLHHHYHRTHRWQRLHRDQDELEHQQGQRMAGLVKALFSTELDSMGLYDKPLARNCQLWDHDHNLILDGPGAGRRDVLRAEATVLKGGLFGYRFFFPPMRAGRHRVYWHRPLMAYLASTTDEIELLHNGIQGTLAAYAPDDREYLSPVTLYPRIRWRPHYLAAVTRFRSPHDHFARQTTLNLLALFEAYEKLGRKPLPRSFAEHTIHIAKHQTLDAWLGDLGTHADSPESARAMRVELDRILEPAEMGLPAAITYPMTARREFEEEWWRDIHDLAHGKFLNQDNADCILDSVTLSSIVHQYRDLEQLGDYLIERHRQAIEAAGMRGIAMVGEVPFNWDTVHEFQAFGGWKRDHEGHSYERNILVVIPGRNRSEAVVMGDHYDTAYMEDVYAKDRGGTGARISAHGADDNHSASATLLQAAPIFLKLAKEGRLERDVWLLHLTGEEFPSDCMGARNFCQRLVEKNLKLHVNGAPPFDLSKTAVKGVFVMDMIAHNRDDGRDIFQISPGKSAGSLRIAFQAHLANMLWNSRVPEWNGTQGRRHLPRGTRCDDTGAIPATAAFLPLDGEIRTHFNPYSSLFNTDCQIFSDVWAPVVLFMENYDINRTGYHDTKDTMANIDLDYGAALAAIAIETVARTAVERKI